MKTIKTTLLAITALLALISTSSAASLSGVYVEVGTAAIGSELDGTVTEVGTGAAKTGDTTTGSVGKTAVTTTYGLGYMFNKTGKFGIDVGYFLTPGEARIKTTTTDSTASNVTFEISDTEDYYVAPMLNITDDASLYVKFGKTSSDVKVTGDVAKITSMDGDTVALGTVMSWGSNLYIRTEAGMTEYDNLSTKGLGTNILTTTTVTASPTVHYGKIALGYKF